MSAAGDWILAQGNRWEGLLREMVGIRSGRCDPSGLAEMRVLLSKELVSLGGSPALMAGRPRPDWVWPKLQTAVEPLLVLRGPHRGGPRVLLCGHLDTVFDPAGEFVAMRDGGPEGAGNERLATGPGVIDMKGGLVSMVVVLAALHQMRVDLDWTVALVPDEEIGSMMSEAALRALAPDHDLGLVFEPCRDNGDLVLSRGGSGQALVEVVGKAAHAGRDPQAGVNAVEALAAAISSLSRAQDFANGVALTVGPIRGGDTTNVVPDEASAWVGLRWRDAAGEARVRAAVGAVERGGPKDLPWVRTRLLLARPAKPLAPVVEQLGRELIDRLSARGEQAGIGHSGGVSDANVLEGAGLPTLDGLGPRGGNMHRTDEFVRLDSLPRRAAAVADLLTAIVERGCVECSG